MDRAEYASLILPFGQRMAAEGLPLLYIQHPRESASAADGAAGRLGVSPTRLDSPMELEILRRGRMPRAVFSVTSTVLDTLPLLDDDSAAIPELWTARVDPSSLGPIPQGLSSRLAAVAAREDLRIA